MKQRRNLTQFNNEVALLVDTATRLDCTALEAAAHLPFKPTNAAIEKAHNRILDLAGLPVR